MSLLDRFLKRRIEAASPEVQKQTRAITQTAIEEVFKTIDEVSPPLADLLAGNSVRVKCTTETTVTVQLEEVHKGAAFTRPKS